MPIKIISLFSWLKFILISFFSIYNNSGLKKNTSSRKISEISYNVISNPKEIISYVFYPAVMAGLLQPEQCISKMVFFSGVLYTKNLYFGNCSISTISNSSFGTEQNATSWKKDKSYEVMLKNPLQYFYLDSNYIYVGKVRYFILFIES